MKSWTTRPMLIATALVGLLLIAAFFVSTRSDQREVTAYFDRAVAVYPGTDLRIMGVQVGEVTAVIPDGNQVRVEMRYDDAYDLPAKASAAVVTPTLVADRYIQVFPPYEKGAKLSDGGEIPLERTQTPIELDRMYKALDDLSVAIGPQNGQTEGGALADLLNASADALEGNGQAGSDTIRNLSAVAEVLSENRGPLFDDVRALASISETLAANDSTVDGFIDQLTGVSAQLAGERDELAKVLNSLAESMKTVEGFIKENREVLGSSVNKLTSIMERVDNQKDALGLVAQKGALAMGNLALAYDPSTASFGSRVQVAPSVMFRPDDLFCGTLKGAVGAGSDAADALQPLCDVMSSLFEPALNTPLKTPDPLAGLGLQAPIPGIDTKTAEGATTENPPVSNWTDLLKGFMP